MPGLVQRCMYSLAACCLAGFLAACAGGPGGSAGFSSGGSGKAELATSSDQTADQKRAAIRLQLASGYYQQGQLEVALDEVKRAILAEPGNAEAYGVRALIYMDMGEPGLAEDNFKRALALAPQNADLSNNYGSFLCQNGRAAQSLAYFDAALNNRTYQSPAKAFNNAGACSLKIRDNAGAERYLLQALKLTPDLPVTNANLARVYYERGDYVQAGFFIARLGRTAKMDSLTADVLWLAIKVQHKLADAGPEAGWVTQLRRHHAGSPEYAAYQRGAYDE